LPRRQDLVVIGGDHRSERHVTVNKDRRLVSQRASEAAKKLRDQGIGLNLPKKQDAKDLKGPLWLALPEDSAITEGGFPAEAPVCIHQKQQEMFSSGPIILQAIVGDISKEVEMMEDAECKIFQEVGHALEEAGVRQQWFCLATCPSKRKWGVGIAVGPRQRLLAAHLALAVSIASEDSEVMASLTGNYPDFPEFCRSDPGTVEQVYRPRAKKKAINRRQVAEAEVLRLRQEIEEKNNERERLSAAGANQGVEEASNSFHDRDGRQVQDSL
jgi:hypothetical protein